MGLWLQHSFPATWSTCARLANRSCLEPPSLLDFSVGNTRHDWLCRAAGLGVRQYCAPAPVCVFNSWSLVPRSCRRILLCQGLSSTKLCPTWQSSTFLRMDVV
ncbi:unnamed protein product, partial [Ectocarpus sp. 12 AP-2014]